MKAIIYTSNSGFTQKYAEMLGNKLNLPVFPLKKANIEFGSEIIYFGWIMAGSVNGYKKACQKYNVKAVCAVGMGATGSQIDDIRKANAISEEFPLFSLQGGFDLKKLHGIYKFMMSVMKGTLAKQVAAKPNKTADEEDMLDLMMNGGDRVDESHLSGIIDWYNSL